MFSSKSFVFEMNQLNTASFLEEENAIGLPATWWLNGIEHLMIKHSNSTYKVVVRKSKKRKRELLLFSLLKHFIRERKKLAKERKKERHHIPQAMHAGDALVVYQQRKKR